MYQELAPLRVWEKLVVWSDVTELAAPEKIHMASSPESPQVGIIWSPRLLSTSAWGQVWRLQMLRYLGATGMPSTAFLSPGLKLWGKGRILDDLFLPGSGVDLSLALLWFHLLSLGECWPCSQDRLGEGRPGKQVMVVAGTTEHLAPNGITYKCQLHLVFGKDTTTSSPGALLSE